MARELTSGSMSQNETSLLFSLPIAITENGTLNYLLGTKDKYLNGDIGISVTTPSGGTFNVTNISGNSSVSVGSKDTTNNVYPIIANNLSVSGQLTSAGWVGTGTLTDSDTDNCTVGKMSAAAATIGSNTTYATKPTIARTDTTASGATNVGSGSAGTSAPGSGYFVSFKATAPATSITLTKTVNTQGYLDTNSQISGNSVSTTAKDGDVYYLSLTSGAGGTDAADVNIYTTDGSNAGVNISSIVGTKTGTEPSSGYYLAFKGEGNSKITTAGWMPTGSLAKTTSAQKYFPITAASVSNAATGSANITSLSYTYNATSGKFDITGSGSISGTATLTVDTAGYLPKQNITGDTTGTASLSNVTVNKIVGSTSLSTTSGTGTDTVTKKPSIQKQAISISGVVDAASGDATTTQPSTGVYVAVKSPANTGKLTATPSVSTAGYGTSTYHGITTRTATYGAAASDVTYVPITTTTATVADNVVSYGTGWITGGSQTISEGEITSGTATISSLSYTYNSTNTNFDISGQATISAPTVDNAGYISNTAGTKNSNTNGAQVSTTVARVKVGVTAGSTNIKVTPVIKRTAIPSGDTWTDAANGAETSTKPSSGPYVQVDAAAVSGSTTVSGKVSSAGYGTTSYYNKDSNTTITGGSNAATTKYIPIKTATPAFDGGTVSCTPTASSSSATISDSTNTSGVSFTTDGTISRSAVLYNGAVNGWVSKSDNAEALAADNSTNITPKTYYINAVSVPANKSFSATATGTVTVTSASNSAGTIKINAYPASGTTKDAEQTIVSGGKWSVKTVAAAGTYYYGKVKANAGTITNNTSGGTSSGTINRGSQIKIGKGFYNADAYYTAQANSGTVNITSSGDTTVDGYVTAHVDAVTFSNSATSGVTYTDYSSSAPIIPSNGYLYINAGYTPARKISLAKLVPDEVTVGETVESPLIHPECTAYNTKGQVVVGTMTIYNGAYTVSTS